MALVKQRTAACSDCGNCERCQYLRGNDGAGGSSIGPILVAGAFFAFWALNAKKGKDTRGDRLNMVSALSGLR